MQMQDFFLNSGFCHKVAFAGAIARQELTIEEIDLVAILNQAKIESFKSCVPLVKNYPDRWVLQYPYSIGTITINVYLCDYATWDKTLGDRRLNNMDNLQLFTDNRNKLKAEDAKRWKELDMDLCMACHAYGEDKRSLFIDCLYDVKEMVPEFIDLCHVKDMGNRGFYLRICKSCRGNFLEMLHEWFESRKMLRSAPKESDGYLLDDSSNNPKANIPIREYGAIKMITREEWDQRQKSKKYDD